MYSQKPHPQNATCNPIETMVSTFVGSCREGIQFKDRTHIAVLKGWGSAVHLQLV